jgi:predicted acylesterase/phospholipase RssA
MENPQSENLKIALAFSGGGYRAACFCLGTLAYLDKLKVNDKSLLEHVVVLSTVSGGTIAGAAYTIGIKQGKDFPAVYQSIYDFIKEIDLITLTLDRLLSNQGWNNTRIKSLINAFADVYDKELFHGAKFGTLMTEENPIHLKHISFNATEFSNALQFRFQWSEKVRHPQKGEPPRGIIGNFEFRIPESAAREIRMADILASSSCFPGGFEPINFPTDFQYKEATELIKLSTQDGYPVGLMDGGIVDNQGIEPILLAEKRMKKNNPNQKKLDNELDLILLSDVASPYMEDYRATVQQPAKWWRRLTPALILTINAIILLLSTFGIYWYAEKESIWLVVLSTCIATLSLVLFIIGRFIKSLPLTLDVPKFFLKPLGKLLRIKLQVYETLIANRKNSMLKMINEVFLKHIRRLNYRNVYNDESWKNRRLMNAIYELKNTDKIKDKINNEHLPEYLMPSAKIQEIAALATSMGTTLWFTPEEVEKKNMMNSIIACGQFTLCWNLLEYIIKLKRDRANTNSNHDKIIALESVLRSDWEAFKADPYCMVNEFKSTLKH